MGKGGNGPIAKQGSEDRDTGSQALLGSQGCTSLYISASHTRIAFLFYHKPFDNLLHLQCRWRSLSHLTAYELTIHMLASSS